MDTQIAELGLIAVVIGTMFEGEAALLLAIVLAHRGYLPLPGVVAAAWIGAILGDQLWYYAGRLVGPTWLERHPAFARRAVRARTFVLRHQNMALLGYRFVYGMRAVVPFVLGMVRISRIKFLGFNVLNALVWVAAYSALGMLFGAALEDVLDGVRRHEKALIWLGITLLLLAGVGLRVRRGLREQRLRRLRAVRRAKGHLR